MSDKKFAVIGHPIGHTMSPFIHKRLFDVSGIDAEYGVLDIDPARLEEEYRSVLSGLCGFNITIPHKQAIIPLLDRLDKKAQLYGSVNTVSFKDGVACGYTTDPDGFLSALESSHIPLDGRVVILGCGGVARTMAYEAVIKGCSLTLAVRSDDLPAAEKLCGDIRGKFPQALLQYTGIDSIQGHIDLLINATPVGMYPNGDAQPVSDRVISLCENVFDAVYNPLETVLVKKAAANGSRAEAGMSMLVRQAAQAHTIWYGGSFSDEEIERLCQDCSKELENR